MNSQAQRSSLADLPALTSAGTARAAELHGGPSSVPGWKDLTTAATSYFALVFLGGFILAVPRILWAAPRFGERTAELIEAPIMLLVILWAAGWVERRFPTLALRQRALVGCGALAMLLAAEALLVVGVREMTLSQYLNGRDIVAGSVYLVMLGLFAAMPALRKLGAGGRTPSMDDGQPS